MPRPQIAAFSWQRVTFELTNCALNCGACEQSGNEPEEDDQEDLLKTILVGNSSNNKALMPDHGMPAIRHPLHIIEGGLFHPDRDLAVDGKRTLL